MNEYMANRTKELKQTIWNKIPAIREKLLRNHQHSSSIKTMVGVSHESYLDLISNPFDAREWHCLSLGPSYIRVNQSAMRSEKQQTIKIENEHNDVYHKVENHLVAYPHYILRANAISQNYSNQLLNYLQHAYSTPN